jgi:hypothetical protein
VCTIRGSKWGVQCYTNTGKQGPETTVPRRQRTEDYIIDEKLRPRKKWKKVA